MGATYICTAVALTRCRPLLVSCFFVVGKDQATVEGTPCHIPCTLCHLFVTVSSWAECERLPFIYAGHFFCFRSNFQTKLGVQEFGLEFLHETQEKYDSDTVQWCDVDIKRSLFRLPRTQKIIIKPNSFFWRFLLCLTVVSPNSEKSLGLPRVPVSKIPNLS